MTKLQRKAVLVRAGFGVLLMLLLGGPTPGAVGSCGSDDLSGLADIQRYCAQREQLVCVRRNLRKEITNGERDDCRRAALKQCSSRSWAPECHPTEREARACLNALSDLDTVKTPEDEISECSTKALCTLNYQPHRGGPTAGTSISTDAGSADEDGGAGESQ
jgi:hypothetical protein